MPHDVDKQTAYRDKQSNMDIICTPSQKINVNDSYGVRSTTVCDAIVEYDNGMVVTLSIRAKLVTDKDTKEQNIVIEPTTKVKNYGDTVVKFSNEQQEEQFKESIMEAAQCWISYPALEAKAISRLTADKIDASSKGKLVRKLPPKDEQNLTLPTSQSTVPQEVE